MAAKSTWPIAGIAASLLAITGAPLLAQDYSGAFTFGYSSGSISDGTDSADVTALTLHGTMQVQFPDGFRFGARLTHVSPDIEGLGGLDLQIRGTELTAGYALSNGAWFGVYSEDIGGSAEGIPGISLISLGQHYYGIEGGTNVAGVAVRGFYGSGNSVTSYGVSGRYGADRYVVGGYFMHSDVTVSVPMSADIDSYGIAGTYAVSDQIALFGGVANSSVSAMGSDMADIMDYGIGASYSLSGMTSIPLFASLEYSGAKVSNPSGPGESTLDGFTLSLTVPMGQSRSMVPENSVAAAVLNPTHSAISQLGLMSF